MLKYMFSETYTDRSKIFPFIFDISGIKPGKMINFASAYEKTPYRKKHMS